MVPANNCIASVGVLLPILSSFRSFPFVIAGQRPGNSCGNEACTALSTEHSPASSQHGPPGKLSGDESATVAGMTRMLKNASRERNHFGWPFILRGSLRSHLRMTDYHLSPLSRGGKATPPNQSRSWSRPCLRAAPGRTGSRHCRDQAARNRARPGGRDGRFRSCRG